MKKLLSILVVSLLVLMSILSATFVVAPQTLTGSCFKLTTEDGCHLMLASDSNYVYYTEYFAGPLSTPNYHPGSVRKVRWNLSPEHYPIDSEPLARGEDPVGVAVDADYVYYTIHGDWGAGKVMRVLKNGGTPELLANVGDIRGCTHAWGIAVDPEGADPYVYFAVRDGPGWWTDPNGYVGKVLKTGGPITALTAAGQVHYPTGVAVDSEYVYYSEREPGKICKVPKNGGDPILLTDQLQPITGGHCMLAIDADWVYFAETMVGGRVGKVAKNGNGTVVFLATNLIEPMNVAIDGGYVYFPDYGVQPAADHGTVKRVPKNGGNVETLVTGIYGAYGIAATGEGHVFFTDHTGYGSTNPGGVYELSVAQISATVDITPDTLNLGSKGMWITAYIELPEGYNVADINVSSVLLNETVPAELHPTEVGDYDGDGIPDLMVKFDRAEIISYILANVNMTKLIEEKFMTITLTITGELTDGTPFQGSDTIKIMLPTHGKGGIFPV